MFEVYWSGEAEDRLADIWIKADDRGAVTVATRSLDLLLKSNPIGLGESRSDSERIAFVPPLVVRFRVEEEDRREFVLTVRHLRQRG